MNFARDVLQGQPPGGLALVELARDGSRREWSFGEAETHGARMAATLAMHGVGRGDVVMTLIGNRPEWVWTMMACFRIGAVALPCTEQLRAKDLRLRLATTQPALIVADARNTVELEAATPDCPVLWTPDGSFRSQPGESLTTQGGVRAHAHARDTPQQKSTQPLLAEAQSLPPNADPPRAHARDTPQKQDTQPSSLIPAPHARARDTPSNTDTQLSHPHTDSHPDTDPSHAHARDTPHERTTNIPPYAELADSDPALITFTSGTVGEPKAVVHGQRYLYGQRTQAERWLGAKQGDLVWCTAASGWSKSARNVFIAPWLMGASALLHDARFDPNERLELIEREQVSVLCMAPTEYRVIAKRAQMRALPSLKGMVAAGEALNPEVLKLWKDATGLDIRDGYGQTETGQMTGMGIGVEAQAGSMGRALAGTHLHVRDGELIADPASVPTFFLGYLGEDVRREMDGSWTVKDRRESGAWRTGDLVRQDADGYLYFEGRADDVIISAGYRIGPFEVESALVAHRAVAEAAAVSAPDEERGAVVRAIVVLREGYEPSAELARELQEHVKRETAPYKYPRIVDFASALPKTTSGKIKRRELRGERT